MFKTELSLMIQLAITDNELAEREEKLLELEFGDEWESYVSKVPKWLPKLW